MDQKVGRLDITMDNIFVMDFFETVTDLLQNIDDLVFRKFSSLVFYIVF